MSENSWVVFIASLPNLEFDSLYNLVSKINHFAVNYFLHLCKLGELKIISIYFPALTFPLFISNSSLDKKISILDPVCSIYLQAIIANFSTIYVVSIS